MDLQILVGGLQMEMHTFGANIAALVLELGGVQLRVDDVPLACGQTLELLLS